MGRLRLKSNLMHDFPEDVARIVLIAKAKGFTISEAEAEAAWRTRSEEWSAGWLILNEDDDHVWRELLEFALEEEDDE